MLLSRVNWCQTKFCCVLLCDDSKIESTGTVAGRLRRFTITLHTPQVVHSSVSTEL